MKKIFVTTFNKILFDKFAKNLIKSFIETNQQLPLYCYVEDDVKLYPKYNNVFFINLFEAQPENKNFFIRNRNKYANYIQKNYLFDAVRFSYKVFAQSDSRKYGDHIFFIDADTFFLKQIPDSWFNVCLPNSVFISLYERLGYYTEAGFLAFNNDLTDLNGIKLSEHFFKLYTSYYINDLIYALPAFTDCHALDATRYRFKFFHKIILEYNSYLENLLGERALYDSTKDLDIMKADNFINQYIVHEKGERKYKT